MGGTAAGAVGEWGGKPAAWGAALAFSVTETCQLLSCDIANTEWIDYLAECLADWLEVG